MESFLIGVLGVVAGVVLLGGAIWFWMGRRLARAADGLGAAAWALCGAQLPPFAITLRRGRIAWRKPLEVGSVSRQFEFSGYLHVDDYAIPEMPNVRLRALWHPGEHSYAVVYDHDESGVFADVVRFFRDDTVLTITSAPETGLDDPEQARHVRVETDLTEPAGARTLHEALLTESGNRHVIPATAEQFPRAFIGAYALEMDWRLARGGPTAAEIRRAAALAEQETPDDRAIAWVQARWRMAISDHWRDKTRAVFLQRNAMSAQEWEVKRERIRIVNDWDDPEALAEELAESMLASGEEAANEERILVRAQGRLREVFAGKTPRTGFAAAQALLPEKRRFELLRRIEEPAGDVYLQPDLHDLEA